MQAFLDAQFGFKDLAGSTSIHVVGGVAALTGSIALGARAGRYVDGVKVPMTSFNLPIATLGALILWMGWFGFNAGSYLSFSSEPDASNVARILLNTNMAAAGGVITAAFISYLQNFRFDLSFMINGALGGLVAITAEPLFPSPVMAIVIGMVGGMVVYWALQLLEYLKIDDVVGAIPVHLFAGAWGTLAVVLSNPDATLMGQLIGLAVIIAYVTLASGFVWVVLKKTIGIRVSAANEKAGLDESAPCKGALQTRLCLRGPRNPTRRLWVACCPFPACAGFCASGRRAPKAPNFVAATACFPNEGSA